jgi:N-acetylmuramoyl-L-alanine amidase
MTPLDQITLALMSWKENRGGGVPGMQSCMNVALNRAKSRNMSIYAVVYEPLQFSSMSYPRDPQLLTQPEEDDPQWLQAQNLAAAAAVGKLPDITNGATSYYALSIPQPTDTLSMIKTVVVAGQQFLKEG